MKAGVGYGEVVNSNGCIKSRASSEITWSDVAGPDFGSPAPDHGVEVGRSRAAESIHHVRSNGGVAILWSSCESPSPTPTLRFPLWISHSTRFSLFLLPLTCDPLPSFTALPPSLPWTPCNLVSFSPSNLLQTHQSRRHLQNLGLLSFLDKEEPANLFPSKDPLCAVAAMVKPVVLKMDLLQF